MIDKITTTLNSLKTNGYIREEREHQSYNTLVVFKLNYEFFKQEPDFQVNGRGNAHTCDLSIKVIGNPQWDNLYEKAKEFDNKHFE